MYRALCVFVLRTVFVFEQVEHGQDLSVVWHQRLSDHLAAHHQLLQHLEHLAHDLVVTGVEGGCGQRATPQRKKQRERGTRVRVHPHTHPCGSLAKQNVIEHRLLVCIRLR